MNVAPGILIILVLLSLTAVFRPDAFMRHLGGLLNSVADHMSRSHAWFTHARRATHRTLISIVENVGWARASSRERRSQDHQVRTADVAGNGEPSEFEPGTAPGATDDPAGIAELRQAAIDAQLPSGGELVHRIIGLTLLALCSAISLPKLGQWIA